jgi:hypothetical protein
MNLREGRVFKRLDNALSDSHPDAWEKPRRGFPIPPETTQEGEIAIGGVRCFTFIEPNGQRWAQPIVSRGWDEGVGAPCNADDVNLAVVSDKTAGTLPDDT